MVNEYKHIHIKQAIFDNLYAALKNITAIYVTYTGTVTTCTVSDITTVYACQFPNSEVKHDIIYLNS